MLRLYAAMNFVLLCAAGGVSEMSLPVFLALLVVMQVTTECLWALGEMALGLVCRRRCGGQRMEGARA